MPARRRRRWRSPHFEPSSKPQPPCLRLGTQPSRYCSHATSPQRQARPHREKAGTRTPVRAAPRGRPHASNQVDHADTVTADWRQRRRCRYTSPPPHLVAADPPCLLSCRQPSSPPATTSHRHPVEERACPAPAAQPTTLRTLRLTVFVKSAVRTPFTQEHVFYIGGKRHSEGGLRAWAAPSPARRGSPSSQPGARGSRNLPHRNQQGLLPHPTRKRPLPILGEGWGEGL